MIQAHIASIAQLTANSAILEYWVAALCIGCDRSSLEMLYDLAEAQDLARQPELLLYSLIWGNGRLWVVGSIEIPRVEARIVLKEAEDLVAADWEKKY